MKKFSHHYLSAFNFDVSTLIDVGVYKGTFELYKAFPAAKIILIDPLEEVASLAESMKASWDVEFYNVAVGNCDGELELHVSHGQNLSGSSINRRKLNLKRGVELQKRTVQMTTLDKLMRSTELNAPYGLKIDVEGAEKMALEGAIEVLAKSSFLILEINLQDIYEERTCASELICMLAKHNFELFDVLNVDYTNNTYLDCIFLPRSDSRFSVRYKNTSLLPKMS